jgi:hypothetical protein
MPVAGTAAWSQVPKAGGVQSSVDLPASQKYGPSNQAQYQSAPTDK